MNVVCTNWTYNSRQIGSILSDTVEIIAISSTGSLITELHAAEHGDPTAHAYSDVTMNWIAAVRCIESCLSRQCTCFDISFSVGQEVSTLFSITSEVGPCCIQLLIRNRAISFSWLQPI